MIYRQAAIDAVSKGCEELRGTFGRCKEKLLSLPSAQPEYRFDEWCTECKEYDQERHRCPRFNAVIRTAIEEMEADRKNGEWIDAPVYKQTQNGKTWDGYTYCSVCKEMHEYGYRSKFCPDCGTKMEGRKES